MVYPHTVPVRRSATDPRSQRGITSRRCEIVWGFRVGRSAADGVALRLKRTPRHQSRPRRPWPHRPSTPPRRPKTPTHPLASLHRPPLGPGRPAQSQNQTPTPLLQPPPITSLRLLTPKPQLSPFEHDTTRECLRLRSCSHRNGIRDFFRRASPHRTGNAVPPRVVQLPK